MRALLRWILNRPMKIMDREGFRDVVTGKWVSFWVDEHGTVWMSTNPWGFGRVICVTQEK